MVELLLTPRQVADALGVSGAALRRAAVAYELTFGDLRRDARGGREFTGKALERLRLALDAVHAGQIASVEVALITLRDRGALPVRLEPLAPQAGERETLARAVVAEIIGELRADLQAVRDENAALRLEMVALRADLNPERLRVLAHATTSRTPTRLTGWRGLLSVLLGRG